MQTRLHHAPVINTILPNCENYRTNVFYKGAVLLNNLLPHIWNIETFDVFKSTIKQIYPLYVPPIDIIDNVLTREPLSEKSHVMYILFSCICLY